MNRKVTHTTTVACLALVACCLMPFSSAEGQEILAHNDFSAAGEFDGGWRGIASTPQGEKVSYGNTFTTAGDDTSVGGNVYNDLNNDGADAGAGEAGVSDVLVRVYGCDSDEPVCEVLTDTNGDWTCDGLDEDEAYRIEFTTPNNPNLVEGFAGMDNGTSVQFATAGNCTLKYGVVDIFAFCEEDPALAVVCFVTGDPNNPDGPDDVVVTFPQSREGNDSGMAGYVPPAALTDKSEVGTVWGVAYDKVRSQLYSAAFVKRHAGLNETDPVTGDPLNNPLGAIYRLDLDGGATELFVDLSTLGVDVGTVPSNAARGVEVASNQPTTDAAVFPLIATVGLGDITLSTDRTTLYAINLFEKTIVSVPINADGTAGTPTSTPIPDPNCGGGEMRPFSITERADGSLFLGVVCDAATSQSDADLMATVYNWDGGSSFTDVLSFPLDYPKGRPLDLCGPNFTGWFPWTDVFPTSCFMAGTRMLISYPQPVLSNIDFDSDGAMVLSFMDRSNHQLGYNNADITDPPEGTFQHNATGGDLLRAALVNGVYVLEQNASAGGLTTGGAGNGQGPGGGEFYFEEESGPRPNGTIAHQETALGSATINPLTGVMTATTIRPGQNVQNNSSGTTNIDTRTGEAVSGYVLFQGGTDAGFFGKGGGLGDVLLLCASPAIQIGNFVWVDANMDGVQQACEAPVAGLPVYLLNADADTIAVTVTDANGNYYFSSESADAPNLLWTGMGVDTSLQPFTDYTLVFGTLDPADNTLMVGDTLYQLTLANVGEGDTPDLNDSDGVPNITLNTGESSNHSFDLGLTPICPFVDLVAMAPSVCSTDTIVLATLVDSITAPMTYDYTWMGDGDGMFLDANGQATTDFNLAVFYAPGEDDAVSGGVVISLVATEESTPSTCPPAGETLSVQVQNTDCGSFFWDGSND